MAPGKSEKYIAVDGAKPQHCYTPWTQCQLSRKAAKSWTKASTLLGQELAWDLEVLHLKSCNVLSIPGIYVSLSLSLSVGDGSLTPHVHYDD